MQRRAFTLILTFDQEVHPHILEFVKTKKRKDSYNVVITRRNSIELPILPLVMVHTVSPSCTFEDIIIEEKLCSNQVEKIFILLNIFSDTSLSYFWDHPLCSTIISPHDFYTPVSSSDYRSIVTDSMIPFYKLFKRVNREEIQYLNLLKKILKEGELKENRTGVKCLSIFGETMRFNLRKGTIPLLTTKRTFFRGVVEELLWFLRGETSSKTLSQRGVKIWDGNGSREFLDSRGLKDREEGDLGPIYGFQWRHYGAEYVDCHSDYEGKGVDQVKEILECLKKDPTSRRMVLTAWNPQAISEMALPPCHVMAIFNVSNSGELNCMVTQRSADAGLGIPFNIASYSIMVRIFAHLTGLTPGELVYVTADTHIYEPHRGPLEQQSGREPDSFPYLNIAARGLAIEQLSFEHFVLMDYEPQESISLEMIV